MVINVLILIASIALVYIVFALIIGEKELQEQYEKQRDATEYPLREQKKRKKYKSRPKATKVEAPHKRKPGRPKKENKK
tara:strand:+ start:289 stop:525 length:237 start_codon:yes stop_codon:yes gene_type:complete